MVFVASSNRNALTLIVVYLERHLVAECEVAKKITIIPVQIGYPLI
jgi:hypothetical protein